MSNRTNGIDSEDKISAVEGLQYDRTGDTSNQDDETAERAIDEDIKWTTRKPDPEQKFPHLEVCKALVSLQEYQLINLVTATDTRSPGRARPRKSFPAGVGTRTPPS